MGKSNVIVVPSPSEEAACIPKYSLSHKLLHKYSPIPVAFSFIRQFLPVNPRSKMREISLGQIPMPLS